MVLQVRSRGKMNLWHVEHCRLTDMQRARELLRVSSTTCVNPEGGREKDVSVFEGFTAGASVGNSPSVLSLRTSRAPDMGC